MGWVKGYPNTGRGGRSSPPVAEAGRGASLEPRLLACLMPHADFPLMDLLRQIAVHPTDLELDYLAGAGRRLMTAAGAIERLIGLPIVVWARPAEARMPHEQGGLMTQTLALIEYGEQHLVVVDQEVIALEGPDWSVVLGRFVARWQPEQAQYWHYVQAATCDRRTIESWLPGESGVMAERIEAMVSAAYTAWLEEETEQAVSGGRRGGRL